MANRRTVPRAGPGPDYPGGGVTSQRVMILIWGKGEGKGCLCYQVLQCELGSRALASSVPQRLSERPSTRSWQLSAGGVRESVLIPCSPRVVSIYFIIMDVVSLITAMFPTISFFVPRVIDLQLCCAFPGDKDMQL